MAQIEMGHSKKLLESMIEAGIVPDNCKRMVIDIDADALVTIYYEVLADRRLLEVDFAKHIGAMITEKKRKESR